jgi:hypothetical protein
MLSSIEYKQKAEDCRRLAKESPDTWAQTVLSEMADFWDTLAARKAKFENPDNAESNAA